jgi:DNA polymerase-4
MAYDFDLLNERFINKWTQKRILHFDLDCFYAAVEMRDNPKLKHVPLAIGGPAHTRSVLCTSNYLARKFGVRSAMSSYQAVKKCPQLVILPPDFTKYKQESLKVHKIFQEYTDKVEGLSLDEAYLDVTALMSENITATQIAKEIREKVFSQTGLTISAGVSFNKFLAKVGSDWLKPNGLFVIPPKNRARFVQELPIKFLYGIGNKTIARLNELKIFSCADLQNKSFSELKAVFGNRFMDVFYLSHGLDFREVEAQTERKSVSTEETFERDITDENELRQKIFILYKDWYYRFKKHKDANQIKSIFVKVKYYDFKQTTHETRAFGFPSYDDFLNLFMETRHKRVDPIRLLGVGVRLEEIPKEQQLDLIGNADFL